MERIPESTPGGRSRLMLNRLSQSIVRNQSTTKIHGKSNLSLSNMGKY